MTKNSRVLPYLLTLAGVAIFVGWCYYEQFQAAKTAAAQWGDGTVRFTDVAQAAGLDYRWTLDGPRPIDILQGIGNGCAFLDYNNDDDLDILLVGPKLALYKGDGKGHFTDVTHATGLDKFQGHFLGCAVGDYDNDGYEDIYISGYRTGLLLHNEHGTGFRDVTQEAGLKPQPWGTSAAFADIDNDGKLDLYVGNYVQYDAAKGPRVCSLPKGMMSACSPDTYAPVRGVLYHNDGQGKFQDVTALLGVNQVSGNALGVAFADFDASGRQSLMIANDTLPSDLLQNQETGFQNVGKKAGIAYVHAIAYSGMGVDWGDYDNDSRPTCLSARFLWRPSRSFTMKAAGCSAKYQRLWVFMTPAFVR